MAKDKTDNTTTDFIGLPAKRGRKPTGNALTPAERQRAYRARQTMEKPTGGLREKIRDLEDWVHHLEHENDQLQQNALVKENEHLKQQVEYWREAHHRIETNLDLLRKKNSLKR